jgi:hypothetical protein
MTKKTTLILAVFVLFATNVMGGKKKDKDKYSVRMGELLVTAVSVDDESSSVGYAPRSSPAPHHDVAIHVRVENLAKQFPCTSLEPFLQVEPYDQYHYSWTKSLPPLDELLPGQVVEFDYSFSARDGTRPVMLVLKAESIRRQRCTEHADWGSLWHAKAEARLPLDGLPTTGQFDVHKGFPQ